MATESDTQGQPGKPSSSEQQPGDKDRRGEEGLVSCEGNDNMWLVAHHLCAAFRGHLLNSQHRTNWTAVQRAVAAAHSINTLWLHQWSCTEYCEVAFTDECYSISTVRLENSIIERKQMVGWVSLN